MRVPLSWLAEYTDLPTDATPESVMAELVKVGLEEEDRHGFEVTGPVVVGQVLEFTPEEQSNGKTIRWCQVEVAPGDIRGIVCGARNFVEGDKVVVSLPGAVLPGGFAIAARKTYGHVSAGMICSAEELGLPSDGTDGIIGWSKPGEPTNLTDLADGAGLARVWGQKIIKGMPLRAGSGSAPPMASASANIRVAAGGSVTVRPDASRKRTMASRSGGTCSAGTKWGSAASRMITAP